MKVTDPVCKMTIEDTDAAATSVYKGITYHFCAKACKEDFFDKNPESFVSEKASVKVEAMASATAKASGDMAKDPVCGMVIPKDRSIKREVGGRTYYFCSENCLRTFEAPEAELKIMKRRIAITLTGVVAPFFRRMQHPSPVLNH